MKLSDTIIVFMAMIAFATLILEIVKVSRAK